MRVLVTGGGGYIGREVIKTLVARGDTGIVFDTGISPQIKALAANSGLVKVVEGDITDLAGLVAACQMEKPDAIVHCAAIVGVLFSINSPSNVVRVNVQGSINVFEAMRLSGIKRVVHMSSEEVYGDFVAPLAREDHPAEPRMAYGITKLAVEHLGRSYRELHGLDPINLRTSWVYGVGLPRPRAPTTFLDAALEGRSYHLDHGGDAAIDFTYMDDVVSGILCALDVKDHAFDVYNLASGQPTTLKEMIATIRELVPGANLTVADGPYRFADNLRAPVKGALDVSRAKEIGFTPKFDRKAGFQAYIDEWRKQHPHGMNAERQ
jgi:UDP-glucose 4-epimerase